MDEVTSSQIFFFITQQFAFIQKYNRVPVDWQFLLCVFSLKKKKSRY